MRRSVECRQLHLPRPGGPHDSTDRLHQPADLTEIVRLYGIRHWIEQSYKQIKDELGWADAKSAPTPRSAAIKPSSTAPSRTAGTPGSTTSPQTTPRSRTYPPTPQRGPTPPKPPSWPKALRKVRSWLALWAHTTTDLDGMVHPTTIPATASTPQRRRQRTHTLNLHIPP
ncbi:hypothetical protein GCM10023170_082710 [Phytohabitans houttuyneae]|uniref:Uncharacterized protein n=1 Tax=Phytohabitans houttuyneae TaxID=1076126 RepID=A0A6V8KJP2_9ACTN|nr:hypothetical protein Phou_061270 [Phytohabitans houttuyneae]